jgi:hypothetical protein
VDTASVAAGDPIAYAARIKAQQKLACLEEKLRHELMDDEERCELWERIIRLRCELGL